MALIAGSRLGPYEIEAALGEGGMGEVYRARDTRLGRTVAIKILHGSLAADPVFTRRLENEARALSRIAHPNICVLHDVGVGNPTYLVLEYLDGTPLGERIARGPLPLEDVRRLGIEICRALQTAHTAGIVHRDLKPANVMLTRSGAKLLDFGIALEQRAAAGVDPTTVVSLTMPGVIVGTPAYMAPEQLNGLGADARSDIFALGVVLYESATGRRAFPGETPAAIAAAILSVDPPPPSTLRRDLPPAFDAIVAGCLARDRDERWQSAHDVGRQIEALTPRGATQAAAGGSGRSSSTVAWLVAALALAAGVAGWATWRRPAAPATAAATTAFKVALAADTVLANSVEGNALALSPDGSQLAWVGVSPDTTSRIWLRPLSQIEARPLPGTEGAASLFWSPDGRSIGFFSRGLLQRLDLNGAGPVVLCPVQGGVGYSGSWGADGRILFAAVQGEMVLRVSTSGGTPERAFVTSPGAGERRIGWPWFLPDGRSVLYVVRSEGSPAVGRVMLARGDGSTHHVADLPTEVQYVDPGYLVFVLRGALLAQRFDPASGQLSGEPVPLASNVQNFPPSGWAGFSAARNGTIAFLTAASDARLVWFDSSGQATGSLGTPGNYFDVNVTPDGQNMLTTRMDGATGIYDIWSIDLARGTETRVTSGPSTNLDPIVLPQRRSLIYSKNTGGSPELYERKPDGSETKLAGGHGFQQAVSITSDGATLIYVQRRIEGDWDIWTLPLNGAHTPSPLIATPSDEDDARLSPDDRVLAFVSDETGHPEVYVAPFPQGTPRIRISTGGGRRPRWSSKGTLMFIADDRRLMRAEVTENGGVRASPVPAFSEAPKRPWRDFLPLSGGRFLAIVPEGEPQGQPLTVITNAVR